MTYKKEGTTYTDFGVLAQFVIAGFIAGSTIEGNEIIGSTFNNGNGTFSVDKDGILSAAKGRIGCDQSGNGGFIIDSNKLYSGKDSISSAQSGVYLGTDGISLGADSTFKVDSLGNLTASSATVTGRITANEGFIGGANGFTIQAGKMYSGKPGINDSNAGIYLGTDGIALGANSVFKVTNGGDLTATSGHIGGANITHNAICSDNGNWAIYSNGTAVFKNVAVTGDNSSLDIGGQFNLIGAALNNFNNLVANKVTANYIDVTVKLSTTYATIKTLESDYVKTDKFEAKTAELGDLIAQKIDAAIVEADYMEVENWVSVDGYIRADRIATNSISADKISLQSNPASWVPLPVVTDVSAIKDENGFVIGISTHKNNIWFLGKNNF